MSDKQTSGRKRPALEEKPSQPEPFTTTKKLEGK